MSGHRGPLALSRDGGDPTRLDPGEAQANDQAIEAFVQALGGRAQLLETLSIAPEAPEVETVLSLLLDPRYAAVSLRRLCTMAHLTVADLFAALKKAMIVKAHVAAYQVISAKLLPVVEDVMRRAAPYEVPCGACAGHGKLLDPDDLDGDPIGCEACAGQGKLLQLPDLDRQKLALELAQLVQKAAGISISQQNVTVPPPDPRAPSTYVDLQHAVRELLSGPRLPIVDAEPVDGGSPAAPEGP